MSTEEIESYFPHLLDKGYNITSPETVDYNCIAWAADDHEAWWWPDSNYQYYWPSEIQRELTIDAFINAYKTLGYSLCNDSNYENNVEKIAIYVDSSGRPTHAARQLDNGRWTSKLGRLEDIEHVTLEGLYSPVYGTVAIIMKRSK